MRTLRAPPSEGAGSPTDGHQPPTALHVGAATASVTSLPEVTTAIGTPLNDATEPLATTVPDALNGLRLARTWTTERDAATAPPKYSGWITAASAAGIPVAVKGCGVTTASVVGATVVVRVSTPFLGVDEHPVSARAPARSADIPAKMAGRDEGRKT